MFIKILFFIYFFYLYNSFYYVNSFNYYFNNIKNIKNINKQIKMSWDYYIDKNLYIYYNNDNNYSFINIERKKGYYNKNKINNQILNITYGDSREIRIEKLQNYHLKSKNKPMQIYFNNSFNQKYISEIIEEMYEEMIELEMIILNKKWKDVKEIIIIEERYQK